MWPIDIKLAIDKWYRLYPDRLITKIEGSWNGIIFKTTADESFIYTNGEFKKY
jgi:hypothetical protein